MDYAIAQEPIVEVLPELCELFHLVYPRSSHRLPQLRRKYLDNPAGPALFWTARKRGTRELCGTNVAMPWILRVGGEKRRCMQVGDLMVHPEHRRKGLSLALFGKGFEDLRKLELELTFAFVRTGGASHGGALKFGAHPIDDMRALKRLVLPSYLSQKWLGKPARESKLDGRWGRAFERKAQRFPGYALMKVERVEADIEALFLKHHDGASICSFRSAEYLNWRHGGSDDRKALLALRHDGLLEGYAALTLDGRSANLVDFYPWQPTEAREALFAHLMAWLSRNGVMLLQLVAPTTLRRSLRGKRLWDRGPAWSLVGTDLRAKKRPEGFWHRSNWLLTPGDCDVGHF